MKKRIIFVLPIALFLCYCFHSCTDEQYMDEIPEEFPGELLNGTPKGLSKEMKEQLVLQAKQKYYGTTAEDGVIELRSSSNGNGNNGNGNNGNGNNGNGNNGNGNNGNGDNGNGNNGNGNNGNGNLAVKPMWNHTSIEQNNRHQAVEILLQMEKTFNFAPPESVEKFKQTGKSEYVL